MLGKKDIPQEEGDCVVESGADDGLAGQRANPNDGARENPLERGPDSAGQQRVKSGNLIMMKLSGDRPQMTQQEKPRKKSDQTLPVIFL